MTFKYAESTVKTSNQPYGSVVHVSSRADPLLFCTVGSCGCHSSVAFFVSCSC